MLERKAKEYWTGRHKILGRRIEEYVAGRWERKAGKYTRREGENSWPELALFLPDFFLVLQGKYNLPVWKIPVQNWY
jgi:hypothetical protein